MIGETIEGFTITAQLGRGGTSEVFVAEQEHGKTSEVFVAGAKLGKQVAIKMLLAEVSDESRVRRVLADAIAAGRIEHAGIVKIFHAGFHRGRAYLIMEFLDGEPLARRLRRELPFADAMGIARQITSVLDAAHAAGITHRGLKPTNIYLVPDAEIGERVRIVDFGIAKLGDAKPGDAKPGDAKPVATPIGTPAYMAPELWNDAANAGPHTDVYALGCVLFELCCTRPPFPVIAMSEARGKHLDEMPPRLRSIRPDIPQALDELVAKMLEKAPADRPATKHIAAVLASLSTAGVGPTVPRFSKEQPVVDVTAIAAPSSLPAADAALASQYESEGRWMELVKLLSRHAESVTALDKPAVYLQIAAIYHDRFANQAEAIKAYERVLELEAGNKRAVEQLRSLHEKRRDWEKLLELEKGELDRTPPQKRADKAVEVARLAASHVGKPDVTIYWWQRVLDYEPDHRQALAELARSFERAERWLELTSVLEQQVDVAPGNDERARALRALAAVREEQLGDLEAARDTWQRVLDIDPGDAEAKRAIERIASPTKATVPANLASSSKGPMIAIGIGVLALAGGAIYLLTR